MHTSVTVTHNCVLFYRNQSLVQIEKKASKGRVLIWYSFQKSKVCFQRYCDDVGVNGQSVFFMDMEGEILL